MHLNIIMFKNPGLAIALGILPGGGSFYTREPGFGLLNILAWPASILWDPIGGYEGAKKINYYITKNELKKRERREMKKLETQLRLKKIDSEQYVIERNKIEEKYNFSY